MTGNLEASSAEKVRAAYRRPVAGGKGDPRPSWGDCDGPSWSGGGSRAYSRLREARATVTVQSSDTVRAVLLDEGVERLIDLERPPASSGTRSGPMPTSVAVEVDQHRTRPVNHLPCVPAAVRGAGTATARGAGGDLPRLRWRSRRRDMSTFGSERVQLPVVFVAVGGGSWSGGGCELTAATSLRSEDVDMLHDPHTGRWNSPWLS